MPDAKFPPEVERLLALFPDTGVTLNYPTERDIATAQATLALCHAIRSGALVVRTAAEDRALRIAYLEAFLRGINPDAINAEAVALAASEELSALKEPT